MIKTKLLFILIGGDKTGKTTLQKFLIQKLTPNGWYEKLPCNNLYNITHPEIKRKYSTISFGNRSYQERIHDYISVENYFQQFFRDADIAFISSHFSLTDVEAMILQGKMRFYNVNAIFLTNAIASSPTVNSQISALNWDERFLVENPPVAHTGDNDIFQNNVDSQLDKIAENIVTLLANRTSIS